MNFALFLCLTESLGETFSETNLDMATFADDLGERGLITQPGLAFLSFCSHLEIFIPETVLGFPQPCSL